MAPPKGMVMGASQIICILLLFLAFILFHFFFCKDACLLYSSFSTTAQDIKDGSATQKPDEFYISLLRRLVKGENQINLDSSSIACEGQSFSVSCVTNMPVSIEPRMDKIHLRHINYTQPVEARKVWPYPWQAAPLKSITPINIYTSAVLPPPCNYNHHVPVVIFSVGGLSDGGNQFHEFNEIIIPLFVTSRLYQSQLHFLLTDYRPSFVKKYSKILSGLTRYPILSPAQNTSVHCFPGAVIGLKFHTILGLNSSDAPLGYSMQDFKEFLRETYTLKARNITEVVNFGKPILILIGREKTRKLVNEDEMVKMMEELGFRVIVARARHMSNLDIFSKILGSCSVLVGVHGAGLTNQVFLPDGALVVQLVGLGLDWGSKVYFGDSAKGMGLRYMEYKIDPEESTLFETYGPDDPVIRDPDSIFAKGYDVGRAIYIQEQNVKVNITRFKEKFVEAL